MNRCDSIFYSRSYIEFARETQRSNVGIFKYSRGNKFALFPFTVNGRAMHSFRYGGLYTNSRDARFANDAREKLLEYGRKRNITEVLIREDPFIKTIKVGAVAKKEPFVYVDLKKKESELKNAFVKSHAKCIRRAIAQGLKYEETYDVKYLKLFYKFYRTAMTKKGAVPNKYTYFEKLFNHLKNNLRLVCIRHKRDVIAVSIILKSADNVFMLYGGMNADGYKRFAKHFMIYHLIFDYKKRGYKRLILGTGNDGQDSIYRFKKGFSGQNKHIRTYAYYY